VRDVDRVIDRLPIVGREEQIRTIIHWHVISPSAPRRSAKCPLKPIGDGALFAR
jgi:hypothetical protein